jgi:hypothetical protein
MVSALSFKIILIIFCKTQKKKVYLNQEKSTVTCPSFQKMTDFQEESKKINGKTSRNDGLLTENIGYE